MAGDFAPRPENLPRGHPLPKGWEVMFLVLPAQKVGFVPKFTIAAGSVYGMLHGICASAGLL